MAYHDRTMHSVKARTRKERVSRIQSLDIANLFIIVHLAMTCNHDHLYHRWTAQGLDHRTQSHGKGRLC